MSVAPGDDQPAPIPPHPQRTELLLEALRAAIAAPGEHRLFRSGKLAGLFRSRVGLAAEAALNALRDGLLETVRTETKGKVVTEWVRATPRAVSFIHEHDSPRSILRELKDVLATTRSGVPTWMTEMQREAASLSARFEEHATAMLARLDELTLRVEAALRRAETRPTVSDGVSRVVPWAIEALEYLDRRTASGAHGDCPFPELFHAIRLKCADLTLPEFQNGLRRLHDAGAVRLTTAAAMNEPEFAMLVGGRMVGAAGR
jgi:hypothetical protein